MSKINDEVIEDIESEINELKSFLNTCKKVKFLGTGAIEEIERLTKMVTEATYNLENEIR